MSQGKVHPGDDLDPEGTEGETQGLSPDLQQHIGNRLRALYDGIVNEPIPDKFMALLNKLDSAEEQTDRPEGDRAV